MIAGKHQRGFTLIEVVVAFAVFALCVGALLESFRGSIRLAARSHRHEVALLVAENVLARVRATDEFTFQSGETNDGLRWQSEVVPEPVQRDSRNPLAPYRVVVSVFDADNVEPSVVLRSVELGQAP